FDLRGHGKSVKKISDGYYAFENISSDIAALAERFKLQKFVLVGHSLGAILAMDFARRHKEKISRLILLAPNYRANKTWRAKIVNFFLLFAGLAELIPFEERIGVHIDYRRFFGTGDWDAGRMYADIKNTSLRVYYRYLRAAKNFDGEKFVAGMDMPVLIIHGRKDTIFPAADSARLAKKMPNARLEILPDANHILVINNFRETEKIMEDFLFNPPRQPMSPFFAPVF
ncbi:MAG: alpha/beta hydrolase, partial [Minisyncoccales bacterium]